MSFRLSLISVIIIFNQEHGMVADEYKDRFWYRSGKAINWSSRKKNISEQKLFHDLTLSFPDLVYKIEMRHFGSDDSRNFERSSTIINSTDANMTRSTVQEQRFRSFGKCYTFSPDYSMRKKGISHISIWL